VDRLTLSVFWEIDVKNNCTIVRHWFSRAVVRSSFALAYSEANAILKGRAKRKKKKPSSSSANNENEHEAIPERVMASGKYDRLRNGLLMLSRAARQFKVISINSIVLTKTANF